MSKNTDRNTANLKKPWKKGETGNPNGRPKGKKNFATIYREALEHLARLNNTTADDLETEMYANAIKKARAGDFAFYRDTLDRLHGKPLQKTDLTTQGERIAFLPTEILAKHNIDGASHNPEDRSE